jgi:Flp pilus assembly protein TadG
MSSLTKISAADGKLRSEKGAILFIVAAGMVVFIGLAGLAIDLGMLYNVRTDLQNATDAAALAGAWKLDGTDAGINAAVTSAQTAANNYKFNNNPISLATNDVTFSATRDSGYQTAAAVIGAGISSTIRFVRADKLTTMDLAMIKVIPGVGSTQNVSAFAVAGQSPQLTTICDAVIPLAPIPQSGGGTMELYTPGYYYTFRMAPQNDVADVGSGNYLILDICQALLDQGLPCNHGGATVRDLLSGAVEGCITLNTPICTKPGVAAGPVRQGLNDRFSQDGNRTEYTDDAAVDVYHTQYVLDPAHNNARRFVVPFVSTTPIPPGPWTPFDNGKNCPVYVFSYGCFFLREQVPGGNGGDIQGEFVGQCDVNGYFDPTTPPVSVGPPIPRKIVLYR